MFVFIVNAVNDDILLILPLANTIMLAMATNRIVFRRMSLFIAIELFVLPLRILMV